MDFKYVYKLNGLNMGQIGAIVRYVKYFKTL